MRYNYVYKRLVFPPFAACEHASASLVSTEAVFLVVQFVAELQKNSAHALEFDI